MKMLDTVFYFILNMSIAACFVIVALLLIRQIRNIPRRVIYPLWGLAFFRLIIPFTIPTSWSLFNFTGRLVKRLITVETIIQVTTEIPKASGFMAMNMIGAAEEYAPIVYKTESLRQAFVVAAVIWIIVTTALLLTAAILYLLTLKELRKAVHIRADLYHSDMVLSPVLAGLIHPKIILPEALDPDSEEGRIILAHENIHKKRWDNLWRVLGIAVVCIHWFNPLAWIMLKMFFTDMELSCDELVVRKYNKNKRKIYAETLLRFAEDDRLMISTAFGQSAVKTRIVNVLNYKRLTLIGILASSLFLLTVAVILVTNPLLRG